MREKNENIHVDYFPISSEMYIDNMQIDTQYYYYYRYILCVADDGNIYNTRTALRMWTFSKPKTDTQQIEKTN